MPNRAIGCLPVHTRRANNRGTAGGRFFARISSRRSKRQNIPGNVGWHTLRHTFGTLMKANGEDIKTIQELLRHFVLQSDGGYLYPGSHFHQACCTDEVGENDSAAEIRTGGEETHFLGVTFCYRTLSNPRRNGPTPINLLFCWRPRRDLNPCYRRERTAHTRL